ncbi:MAG TPA: VWA domain-containing protein [Streptosporangiaceae bacterium]|nr:VWA domain-containing protein [Streptosporangiaceae bacterium]
MAGRPTLAGFIAELRTIGLPVSVSENVDAMAAVLAMPIADRAALKSALAATLVKSADHYHAFEVIFDLFFGDSRVGIGDLTDPAAGPAAANGAAAAANGAGRAGIVAALSDADLSDLLFRAALAGDQVLIRAAVAEAVSRYADVEPGRPVAGVYYLYRTLRRLDMDRLTARLIAADNPAGLPEMDRALAAERRRGQVADIRTEAEAEIRRRLVADRGAAAVARTLRVPLPEDVDFLNASAEQLAAIRQAVQLLGRKLAARLVRKRRHHRRSALDFRRTIRKSLGSGGVPADLVFRKPHPSKPEIMLIADVSSSVAAFAGFTLQLASVISSEFSRVRSFAFTDGIEEITDDLGSAPDITAAVRSISSRPGVVRLDGHSDYGMVLESFWERWGPQIKAKTSVIILGDGRSNYHASRSYVLRAIRQRARHLYWLNPEPAHTWDSGDSIISEYGKFCDEVVECRNLRQLKEFVEALD